MDRSTENDIRYKREKNLDVRRRNDIFGVSRSTNDVIILLHAKHAL